MEHYIGTGVVAVALSVLVGVVAGCDPEPSPYDEPLGDWVDDEGRMIFRDGVDNAEVLNGLRINGLKINGLKINGLKINGLKINGLKINGTDLNNVTMNGNNLRGNDASNNVYEGADLEDLRVNMEVDDPVTQETKNFEVSQTELETLASGLVMQTVKRRELPSGGWENACDNGAKAILLKGAWDEVTAFRTSSDPDRTTYACAGAALGDCALWGYVPGQVYNGASLDDYHQTCIHLKGARYCGNGVAHTQNGHNLDVYDRKGIMNPETIGLWGLEGMWGPNGAVCLNFTRKLDYTKDVNEPGKEYIGCNIPACVDVNNDGNIDFADYPTALLADRTIPKWKT